MSNEEETVKALVTKLKEHHAQVLRKVTAEEVKTWPKDTYELRLVSYGGDPDGTASIKNTMGAGSFALALRDQLAKRSIAADVWAHTDAGHTSRNARMRLFAGDGVSYDLVRLVFGETADFKTNKQPSRKQLHWWWGRGKEDAPLAHQQAVKKAALCSLASLKDDKLAFSLKALIADFRRWAGV